MPFLKGFTTKSLKALEETTRPPDRITGAGLDTHVSEEFNVNEYWLRRGREGAGDDPRYADYHRLQEHFLFEMLSKGQVPLQNILELGCGSGRITRLLAENSPGARITALDLSLDRLEMARRRCAGAGDIQFEQYDFYSDAPLPGSGYDAVIAVEVFLHHPRNLVRSLMEKLSAISRFLVNIDWSETWPW